MLNQYIPRRFKHAWPTFMLFIAGIDQSTKYLIQNWLHPYQSFKVFPFLNFQLTYNPGIAFSFFPATETWQRYLLIGMGIAFTLLLLHSFNKNQRAHYPKNFSLGLSLMIGGALGNLTDRIMHSHVIDFIDFHINHWHFANFNLADSAIVIGCSLLVFYGTFSPSTRNRFIHIGSIRKITGRRAKR